MISEKRKNGVLFVLTESDAQNQAGELIGRKLTEEELESVKRLFIWGLGGGWREILNFAISEGVKQNGKGKN